MFVYLPFLSLLDEINDTLPRWDPSQQFLYVINAIFNVNTKPNKPPIAITHGDDKLIVYPDGFATGAAGFGLEIGWCG